MKRILFSITLLAAVLFSANVNAQIIDNFETSKGTFDRGTVTSGQISGLTGTTPELDATMGAAMTSQSLQLVYKDDGTTDDLWYDRFLSGAGGTSAANQLNAESKFVGFWVASSSVPAGATLSLLVKALGTSNYYIQSTELEPINDGAFHLYEWDMTKTSDWKDWATQTGEVILGGSGGVLAGTIHINALIVKGPANSPDWIFNLDEVGATVESRDISTSINGTLALNSVKIFPTVTSDAVTLQFNLNEAKNLDVNIYDYQGRIVYSRNMNVTAGGTRYSIDMSEFASSLYIAKVKGENFNQSIKIIKK